MRRPAAFARTFSESVLPGLNATFGNAGQTGGSAHALATGRAAGQLADTVGGVRSDIYGRAYESDQDRRLQSNLALLGSGEAGLDRAQRGLTSAAGLEESRLGRGLQGLTSAAGFAGEDLNRDQRGLLAAGQLAGQDLARNQQGQQFQNQLNSNRQLEGLTTAGILGGQDLSRQAGSEQFQRGLNSQRQFQSAGLIPVSSALEQQRTGALQGFGDQQYQDLAKFVSLISGLPLQQSTGSGKSKGFGTSFSGGVGA